MGLFGVKTYTAMLGDRSVTCRLCGADRFLRREVTLNTSGMELLDLGWANESALGLICVTCGLVHEFAGDALDVYRAED